MAVLTNILLFLCTCMLSALNVPTSWNQRQKFENSQLNAQSHWTDQANSPSSNWYQDDAPILAQSEISMPDYVRKQSGFALYPVNKQEQLSFGTKLYPQKVLAGEQNHFLKNQPLPDLERKHQRRSDFSGAKLPPKKWNIGPPYPQIKYYKPKHPTDEVLKVKSLSPQNFRQVFKAEETPKSIKTVLKGNTNYKPSVHRELALSAISHPSLNQHSPQNPGYILSAPTNAPIELTTKKEPIFFVTDGYRNVLLQGPNKSKPYQDEIQNKQESINVELGKIPNKRKVAKVSEIYNNRNQLDGIEQQAGAESYRDDTLHEPTDDHDNERDDDESEKINDGDDIVENDEERETKEEEDDENTRKEPEIEANEEEPGKTDEEGEREDSREPDNEHADPKPVPTKPIYPGEGVWARQRVRHRPHITQHRFIQPQENQQHPDGYDIFSDLESYFNQQRDNFGQNFGHRQLAPPNPVQIEIKEPNSVVPLVVYDPFQESHVQNHQSPQYIQPQQHLQVRPRHNNIVQETRNQHRVEPYNARPVEEEVLAEEAGEFVPQRLYTQVRNSENEQHLPYNPGENGRLKAVIKDSKVHTLYSEEGYEDSAYDHAGHEKKAQEDQGLAKYEKDKQESRKKKKVKDNQEGQSIKIPVTESPKEQVEDSVPADSTFPDISDEINNKKGSMNTNNNYITTQEIKTTQIKDKNNGDVQLEIESQVQVIMQPNNSTKAHKYVKIYPKVLKDVVKEQSTDKVNETSPIVQDHKTESDVVEEINKMTLKQFNIEEDILKSADETERLSESLNDGNKETKDEDALKGRRKRSSERWFEDVNVDTEFVDKINHKFEPPRKEVVDSSKFPYYTKRGINKNSPIRYAENPNNVPIKKVGELSFYKEAERHSCPEIVQDIDPVPDHVKNAKEADDSEDYDEEDDDEESEDGKNNEGAEDDEAVTPKGPRIELGDKIDCLKARYFGENPLDNPFFKEKTVGPVESLFKELDKTATDFKTKNTATAPEQHENEKNNDKSNEIFHDKDKKEEKRFESQMKDVVFNALQATAENINEENLPAKKEEYQEAASIITNAHIRPIPNVENSITPSPFKVDKNVAEAVVSLITTPKYTIKLTPNNIYDQIMLLDHLPDQATESVPAKVISEEPKNAVKEIQRESTTIASQSSQHMKENIKDVKVPQKQQSRRKSKVLDIDNSSRNVKKESDSKAKEFSLDKTKGENKSESHKIKVKQEREQSRRTSKVLNQPESSRRPIVAAGDSQTHSKDEPEDDRQPKSLDPNREAQVEESPEGDAVVNEPQALRRLRKRPRRPMYQIFDINKFLTTTPFSLIDSEPTTVLPKYKVISEVFYKDDIKPNEQLNVFADVLNNIKNSSYIETIPIQSASDFSEPNSVRISNLDESHTVPQIRKSSNVRVKKFQSDSSNYNRNNVEIEQSEPNYSVETERFPESYVEKRHRQHMPKNRLSNNGEENTTKKVRKTRRRTTTTTTTLRTTTVNQQNTPSNHRPFIIDYLEDTEKVIGLVPPESWQYKTIVDDAEVDNTNEVTEKIKSEHELIRPMRPQSPAPVTELIEEPPPVETMNLFYVIGMKPPLKERARPYFEYLGKNKKVRRRAGNIQRKFLRLKREAARPNYSELSRNRGRQDAGLEKPIQIQEEVDDYVPHRPKNYHYDEETGKIIYHNKPQSGSSEEEEVEVEEIEVPVIPGIYLERAEDATHPTPKKTTQNPLLITATPPPDGQGLLDFVLLLKNNPNYKYIPDPTTPKPGSETSTTETFVTIDPKSTSPPEFLSILSKVKTDNRYKLIEDPKDTKSKPRTTTSAPEEKEVEVEVEEEEQGTVENIIVQPNVDISKIQIFNVGDFLPKIQTPISSDIKTSFVKKYVVDKLFPKLRYMTVFDVVKDYLSQTAPVQYIKSKINISTDDESGKLNNIDIFDINEFIPAVQPIVTSKPIDYSKYKTIERPRHNLSSRYNADEQTNLEEVVTVGRPILFEEVPRTQEPSNIEESEALSVEEIISTTQRMVQSRRRSRPKGQRQSTSRTVDEGEPATTSRNSSRRRVRPSGSSYTRRPTTQITEASEEFSEVYLPTERMTAATHPKAKRQYRRRPIRIRPTTERMTEDEYIDHIMRRSVDGIEDDNLDANSDRYILIEQDLLEDLLNKHIDSEEVNNDNSGEVIEVTDDANISSEVQDKSVHEKFDDQNADRKVYDGKIRNYKIDERDANTNIAQDLIQEVDALATKKNNNPGSKKSSKYNENKDKKKRKKKGRKKKNNKKANKKTNNTDNIKVDEVEIVNENYDRTKKHGGNYKAELDVTTEKLPENSTSINGNTSNEETANQKYNTTIKNERANHREEESIIADLLKLIGEPLVQDTKFVEPKTDDVDVINKNYDKSKKHGGNYQSEQDAVLDDILEQSDDAIKDSLSQNTKGAVSDIQIISKDYIKNKQHGGNYKSEQDAVTDKILEPSVDENKTILLPNIKDAEIINKKYDKNKKNGGNYQSEQDGVIDEILEKSDDANKDSLPQNTKEDVSVSASKKLVGNFKSEQDDEIDKVLEDTSKVIADAEQQNSGEVESRKNPQADVDIVDKNYNHNKKHGGNYKTEKDAVLDELLEDNSEEDAMSSEVEYNKDSDRNVEHGGNYKSEQDVLLESKEPSLGNLKKMNLKAVDVIETKLPHDDYEKSNTELLSYKPESGPRRKLIKIIKKKRIPENEPVEENVKIAASKIHSIVTEILPSKQSDTIDPPYSILSENVNSEKRVRKYENSYDPVHSQIDRQNLDFPETLFQRRIDHEGIPKLADVVLKPEYFYTDPDLPIQINKLNDHTIRIIVDAEDLEKAIEEGDVIKSNEMLLRDLLNNRRVYETEDLQDKKVDENILSDDQNNLKESSTSTTPKIPFFIKDPSKRLYFYAAV